MGRTTRLAGLSRPITSWATAFWATAFWAICLWTVVLCGTAAANSGEGEQSPIERGAAQSDAGDRLEALRAFARLYGYVRYFHPSDEAADLNWEAFAVHGVEEILATTDPVDLRSCLERLFGPVAPTLTFYSETEDGHGANGHSANGHSANGHSPAGPPAGASLVAWQHRGVGIGPRSIYKSLRTIATEERLFPQVPPPESRIRKDIGAGLVADLPLVLWSNGETVLRPADPPLTSLQAALDAVDLTGRPAGDPALHLAGVVIAWNVFQHFYPYFDVISTDWDAELSRRLEGALNATDAWEQYENLRRLAAALEDGHAYVFNDGLEVGLAGLPWGVEWIEDEIVVTASEIGGVLPGDVVEAIDGTPVKDLLAREMSLTSGTESWRRWKSLGRLGLGPEGSRVVLTLRRGMTQGRGGSEIGILASRDRVGTGLRQHDYHRIDKLPGGFFYVDLSRAGMDEIEEQIEALAKAPGIVFDLRGYPNDNHDVLRYLIDEPVRSAHWNVPRVLYPDQEELTWDTSGRWYLEPREPRLEKRPVFLMDGRAISYAESVMGIVEAYDLGDIVGQPTAGANGNVNPFDLPGGYRMGWTGMKVIKHDGTQHHLVGILPTVPWERTIRGVRAGRDEVLEKALEILRSRL